MSCCFTGRPNVEGPSTTKTTKTTKTLKATKTKTEMMRLSFFVMFVALLKHHLLRNVSQSRLRLLHELLMHHFDATSLPAPRLLLLSVKSVSSRRRRGTSRT